MLSGVRYRQGKVTVDSGSCKLTAIRPIDKILHSAEVPILQKHYLIFLHDNAQLHVAGICQDS